MELTKAGKGVKIMAIVDRCGLPLSIGTHSAQRCEAKLVQLSLDLMILDDHPENLVGDKVYDSDPLGRRGQEARRRDDRALPEVPDTPEDAGRSLPAQVQTALDCRVFLRLASVEPSRPHPMGITRLKLTWIRPVRGYMPAAQATLLL